MNAAEVKSLLDKFELEFNQAQFELISNKLSNVAYFDPAEMLMNCPKNLNPQKFVDLVYNHSNKNNKQQQKINAGEYMTVPKLSNIPAFVTGKLIPCAVPKISIPGPNCKDNLLPNYIARADFLGLMPYVLAYFDNMFMIDNIRPLFTKHMSNAEFERRYQESKTLWARPSEWDEPVKEISSSYEEYKRTA